MNVSVAEWSNAFASFLLSLSLHLSRLTISHVLFYFPAPSRRVQRVLFFHSSPLPTEGPDDMLKREHMHLPAAANVFGKKKRRKRVPAGQTLPCRFSCFQKILFLLPCMKKKKKKKNL
ncbi:hypothetical protein AA313_de0202146 [Arthrobotrys entomopaga]|nr:hypothetical protein AA313_de0202146 [Arthrobotrys entomopaga]